MVVAQTPTNGVVSTFDATTIDVIACTIDTFTITGGDTVTPVETTYTISTGAATDAAVETPALTYVQTFKYGANNCPDFTETITYKIDGTVNDLSAYSKWLDGPGTSPNLLKMSASAFNRGSVAS